MRRNIFLASTLAGAALAAPAARAQSNDQTQPPPARVIYLVRGNSGFGVPAAFPSSMGTIQGVPAAVGPRSANEPIRQIPIVRTLPGGDVHQAPLVVPGRSNGVAGGPASGVPAQSAPGTDTHWNRFTHHGDGVNVNGSSINGKFSGDDWRLAFHIGDVYPYGHDHHHDGWPLYPSLPYRSYYWPWSDYASSTNYGYYDPYAIVQNPPEATPPPVAPVQPALATQPAPVREPTALERAAFAYRAGNLSECIRQLRAHMKDYPDDAGVERLLAIALLDDHKVDQAVAVIIHSYTKQPQLAKDPIDWRVFGQSELDHRARFNLVMDYANRTRTAGALFAAAVLAQSEGRMDIARKLLDRAIKEGLDKNVANEMTLALVNR